MGTVKIDKRVKEEMISDIKIIMAYEKQGDKPFEIITFNTVDNSNQARFSGNYNIASDKLSVNCYFKLGSSSELITGVEKFIREILVEIDM